MKKNTSYRDIIIALTQAIDLINYLLKHHHRRVSVLSYHIGREMGFSSEALKNLVVSAALHDIGALKVAERDELIHLDIKDPKPHAELGHKMIKDLPYFEHVAKHILYHHQRYDEYEQGMSIPKACFVLHLADRVDILLHTSLPYKAQLEGVIRQLTALSGSVFMPEVLEAFIRVSKKEVLWLDLDHLSLHNLLTEALDVEEHLMLDLDLLEGLALTFSKIIDFRSPFTRSHSQGVGMVAYAISKHLGFDHEKCVKLKIAGYLHDIGKIGIPTELIDKKGALTPHEYEQIKAHSYYTHLILSEIPGLHDIVHWASAHHENHQGTGYPYKLTHHELSLETDIITYSDVFCALLETRPYRGEMQKPELISAMKTTLLNPYNEAIFAVLQSHYDELYNLRKMTHENAQRAFL